MESIKKEKEEMYKKILEEMKNHRDNMGNNNILEGAIENLKEEKKII